jgi:hypothetical protein
VIDVKIPGYRVLRILGAGGMATVYLAEQESLEREVALKVMAPALAANAEFCQQFLKEGRITAKLSHPNLVTVHDIGCHEGVYYMASEYLPAGTLRDRLQRGLGVAEALGIARDVAAGLAYAHHMGFVHRDVKPGNILFRASGSAVLADFGIAKAIKSISSATMAGTAIGTPDYMSPEQAQATLVDGRTDIYSLGAVLYEMLSGRKPYTAHDPYAVALRHVTDPVPRLDEGLAWLQPLIDRAMAKDREERFATGTDLIDACDELLATHPEIALPAGGARRTPVPVAAATSSGRSAAPGSPSAGPTRPLRWATLLAVVAVLALVVLVWRWSRPGQTSAPLPQPAEPTPAPVSPMPIEPATDPLVAAGLDRLRTPALLARAGNYLEEGLRNGEGRHLSFPDGDNAIDLFREVLKREPENIVAKNALARIAAFYADSAQRMYDRGLDTAADELIEKGLRAAPDDAKLRKLKAALAQREAERG